MTDTRLPEGWIELPIEKLARITTGSRDTKDREENGEYPFFVRSQTVERINSVGFDGEGVLTAGDGVGTGKIFHYINGKCDFHQRVYLMHSFSPEITGRYFYFYFSSFFYDRIMSMTAKSSVDSVRREMIADMMVRLPMDPKEQDRIVEALSDADALIEGLERLIAKKRLIKQGAMQDLLTAKRRLPGFSGEWTTAPLRQLCSQIQDGTHFTPTYVEYGTPFYSVENVTARNFDRCKYVTPEAHEAMAKRCRPARGDILMTRIGSIGDTYLVDWDHEASIYVSLCLLRPGKSIDARYLYAYSRSSMFVKEVEDRSLPNAIPKKINLGDIANVHISMPIDPNEQAEIAAVLTDMDTEIQTLETRLEKTRQVKEGMMQNLLTGRIRLV